MTAKHRVILSATAGIISLMLLFPPYEKAIHGLRRAGSPAFESGYDFIFSVVTSGASVNMTVLMMQMAICLLIGGALTLCVK